MKFPPCLAEEHAFVIVIANAGEGKEVALEKLKLVLEATDDEAEEYYNLCAEELEI